MQKLVDGVWLLAGFPRNMFNVYMVEDVLVDTGTRWARRRILRQVEGRPPRLVVLTHCHPDHQGCAKTICEHFQVPLACHHADVLVMEGRAPMQPNNRLLRLGLGFWAGPPHPVARVLRDGDEVAGFRVIHAPGHTAGHIILFRDSDRVAIAGDVLANIHFFTGRPGLREPPRSFSADAGENRRSIRALVDLKPSLVCFGHGPALYDTRALQQFVERRQASWPAGLRVAKPLSDS